MIVNNSVLLEESARIPDLVDEGSWILFSEMQISRLTWLHLHAEVWNEDGEIEKFKTFCNAVKVTNNVAERGLELLDIYLTKGGQF